MKVQIDDYRIIAKALRTDYPKMSDFEILSLAIQIERNAILENGLGVNTNDKTPSNLEAIAIALGYSDKSYTTVANILQHMVK